MKFPIKAFHKKLVSLGKDSFNAGNLTVVGKSRDLYIQIKHEGVKNLQHHDDIHLSIAKTKEKFTNEIVWSKIKGYIQYYSIQRFIVGLWAAVVLCSMSIFTNMQRIPCQFIASKVNGKMVFYYTFLLTSTIKKLEPLPLLEILTYSYDEKP